jgi:cytochrome P450
LIPETAPGVAELRRDPEQALLAASELGELVWVRVGRRRLLLVSGPDGAREALVERAGDLAKPRSQAIPLGRRAPAVPNARLSPGALRRALSKGMGADSAEQTARGLGTAVAESAAAWRDGESVALLPWLRPLVARAVVRGAFASDLSGEELERLAGVVAWAGRTPRVSRSGPTRHGIQRPFVLAQLSLVVRSLLANADRSRPSELSALEGLDRRERQALAGELLLGAVGPLVQESGWALFRLGTEPEPADMEAFVREVTRLHPTNPLLARVATAGTSIGGEPVAAGSLVVVNVAALHRDPAVYAEPERFLPERWLDGRTAEHRFSYAAFGIGDRRCLGETIALRSLVALLETVSAEWHLSFDTVDVAAQGRRQLSDDVRAVVSRARG